MTVNIVLDGDTDLPACDAEVIVEDGDFLQPLDRCANNTFTGPYERFGRYKVTASHPGYAIQTIDEISVYQFICNVETIDIVIPLVPIVN